MNIFKLIAVLLLLIIAFSCDKYDLVRTNPTDFKSKNFKPLPELTTITATVITSYCATVSGNVISEGASSVTARGICWSTSQSPTIADNKTTNGIGMGSFTGNLINLTPNTTYYVRAYATNSQGTSYGNQVSFTTDKPTSGIFIDNRDGNEYNYIKIGNQIWMGENLAYLPMVNMSSERSSTLPYYYVYDYNGTDTSVAKTTSNYKVYGVLYNWPAAMNGQGSSDSDPSGVRGACPAGWHLPSTSEWIELVYYLGGDNVADDKMKEVGDAHWLSPNDSTTNCSGFTAIPAGYCNDDDFYYMGESTSWWTATENNVYNPPNSFAYSLFLDYIPLKLGCFILASSLQV